ncbi:hypothetical protein CYR55_14095 [Chimaeribacter californicus]|uniref:Uncharacterized protein n=2 Tax=Chimaeribacter californicus TaxID=2060067 RepID=A0A2N5E2W0_9GAMM|nr:hypothetical protein CYR55_14095 [Chimaeribacter californicus]
MQRKIIVGLRSLAVGSKWVIGSVAILLTGCGIAWLGIKVTGSQAAFTAWLDTARPWLQLWRLVLYALMAGLWFSRVRGRFLLQLPIRQVRRLELLTLMLFVLIELGAHHHQLFQGAAS